MLHPRHTKKRWFIVHVRASLRTTQRVVNTLEQKHKLIRRSDGRRSIQTFDILIAPKILRKIQDELPHTITIAYEPKTPDT